ncbi:MAG: type I restriction endonuclease [Chloroflexi bacterium]|nr:type I restriction endonuclease [Chloroflexota bacterium]
MTLLEELCNLAGIVERNSVRSHELNESETRRMLIIRFISALGFETGNPREVKEESQVDDGYVDYAIKRNGQPIILIEAKHATEDLSKWLPQLQDYFSGSDAKIAILTNGREYRFYTDLHTAKIMDKVPFLEFDLRIDFQNCGEDERKLADDLEWFTNAKFSSDRILAVARRRALIPILKRELSQPSRELASFFAKQVTAMELPEADAIYRYTVALREAASELMKNHISKYGMVVADVTEIELFAEYRGQRFTATLLVTEPMEKNGRNVVFEDDRMNYQEATDQAIRSVNPEESFVSGWDFWQFTDPDTIEVLSLRRLFFDAELRERVRKHKYRR